METRFLTTLRIAHLNCWDWNLKTRELHLINTSDAENMKRISPRMAVEEVTISDFPEVLSVKNIVHSENWHLIQKYSELVRNAVNQEEVAFRLPFHTMDGDIIWIQFCGKIVGTENGSAIRAIGYYTDITKQIEIARTRIGFEALQEAYDNNVYANVIHSLSTEYSNIFWIDLANGTFQPIRLDELSNSLVGALLEKVNSYQDILRFYFERFVMEADRDKLEFLMDADMVREKLVQSDVYSVDYRSHRLDETVYCQMKIAVANQNNRDVVTIGFRNIDDEYRERRELGYDSLTGLYNRAAFFHYVQKLMQGHPECRFDLIISDIAKFKRINEIFGEKMGDELLRYVGNYLNGLTEMFPNITYGRYSGDQFVGIVMSPKDSVQENGNPAEFLTEGMKRMSEGSPIGSFEVKFGLYLDVDPQLTPVAICDRALMALRTIKDNYQQIVAIYDQQMEQSYQKELRILENMEEALAQEQFRVYYQAKHDCQTGELIGAEALVRWEHPEYGFMSPGDFIPVFEKNGFITKLDLYVFQKVLEYQTELREEGIRNVPISINASRRDLLVNEFAHHIVSVMKEKQAEPSWFHVEVTENLFMKNAEQLRPVLSRIKESGMQIELDDFGSGYSSLSILTSLPLDTIKLDMGLIRNMNQQKPVVEASIRLAHVLGYTVTAEGVENADQLRQLREMGCDAIQGYYYSRPIPEAGFKKYILQHTEV